MIKREKKRVQKKGWRKWWWLWGILFLLLGTIIVLLVRADEPPAQQITLTRTKLSEAERINAEIYSRSLYKEAKSLYEKAMREWKSENEKFILFRSYDSVRLLAVRAERKAREAVTRAQEVQRHTKEGIEKEIAGLRQDMKKFERLFNTLPLSARVKSRHSKGKLLLNEAEIAFEKEDYNTGRQKSHEAARMIGEAYRDARGMLADYFDNLPLWQQQLKAAIARSQRSRSYLIVVEKIPACCKLYYKGEEKYSFPAEFGKNWIGTKNSEGDYATPEGDYSVTKKLDGRSTIYYKALLINYPNPGDRERIARLKKEGSIQRHLPPGGLIEIHGGGGRGVNWTNGCVALADKDMDVIYRHAHRGTPILIIGASGPMEQPVSDQKTGENNIDKENEYGNGSY